MAWFNRRLDLCVGLLDLCVGLIGAGLKAIAG